MALQLNDSGGTVSLFGGRPKGRPYYIRFPLHDSLEGDPRVAPTIIRFPFHDSEAAMGAAPRYSPGLYS